MEELEVSLLNHHEIRNVVLLVETADIPRLMDFFKFVDIDYCSVVCMQSECDIKKIHEALKNFEARGEIFLPEKTEFTAVYDFKGFYEDGDWALCPIGCDYDSVIRFLGYNPTYLIGSIYERAGNSFLLWEKARKTCKYINIKTFFADGRSQVLEWTPSAESKIELSVVLPVYNVEKYIEKCIKTITQWKADYLEFIFVSDGSQDGSVSIIKKWMKNDPRIVLIEKENGGCASARQRGLDEAKGRYVGFVDPDDFVDESMFRKLLRAALEGSFEISLCGYNEYYENTGNIKHAEDSLWYPYIGGCYDNKKIIELITYCRVAIWRGIYRLDFLKANNISFYTDLRRFDDLPFKVETFAFAKSVVIIPEYLYYYRLEREGQDVTADDERLYVHFDIFKHLNESIGKKGIQQLNDNLQMCKLQTHRYALSKIRHELRKNYVKMAQEDLRTLDSVQRTYMVINKMLGRDSAEEFRKIMQE